MAWAWGVRLPNLSLKQLVARRLASDVQMPGLADRALAEHLDADLIKRAVKDWQTDALRT